MMADPYKNVERQEHIDMLERALSWWTAQKGSEATAKKYWRGSRDWVEWLESDGTSLFDADTDTFELYVVDRSADLKNKTMRGRKQSVSLLHDLLPKFRDDAPPNPIDDFEMKQWDCMKNKTEKQQYLDGNDEVPRLKLDEVRKLLDNVPAPSRRNRLIIQLLLDTGWRREELASVKEADVDTDTRQITTRNVKDPNNPKKTSVYTTDCDKDMKMWLTNDRSDVYYATESDYLFPTHWSDTHISGKQINTIVTTAADEDHADIQEELYENANGVWLKKVTAHSLRHTFGTMLADNPQWNMKDIRDALNHSSLDMAQKYMRSTDSEIQDKLASRTPMSEMKDD